MAYQLQRLTGTSGNAVSSSEELSKRIEQLMRVEGPRMRRLWAYYRNPMRAMSLRGGESGSERPYRQAQEWGMPSRLTGMVSGQEIFEARQADGVVRKEVVIENDIGWRIDTMVDYLFGKPIVIRSAAPDPSRREMIDRLVRAILAHNGGLLFLQQLALLGAVYGFVDVLVKVDVQCVAAMRSAGCGRKELGEPPVCAKMGRSGDGEMGSKEACGNESAAPALGNASAEEAKGEGPPAADDLTDTGARTSSLEEAIQSLARLVRLEIVEPPRALPLLSAEDYRVVEGYVQCYQLAVGSGQLAVKKRKGRTGRWWEKVLEAAGWVGIGDGLSGRDTDGALVTEIITADRWQKYKDEALVAEGANSLGEIPLVHVQNTAVPFEYSGVSDAEGLVPLQDELNTRLSDRAVRIALQSFKMYLGKGIENFTDMPIAPGQTIHPAIVALAVSLHGPFSPWRDPSSPLPSHGDSSSHRWSS